MEVGLKRIKTELKTVRKNPDKSIEADYVNNPTGELVQGALFLLLSSDFHYPKTWSEKFRARGKNYQWSEALTVAGVFIAAELSRYEKWLDEVRNYTMSVYEYDEASATDYRNCGGLDRYFKDGWTPQRAVDEDMSLLVWKTGHSERAILFN